MEIIDEICNMEMISYFKFDCGETAPQFTTCKQFCLNNGRTRYFQIGNKETEEYRNTLPRLEHELQKYGYQQSNLLVLISSEYCTQRKGTLLISHTFSQLRFTKEWSDQLPWTVFIRLHAPP